MKTRTMLAGLGLALVGSLGLGAGTASATIEMQKKAKAAGVEVQNNCLFCHGEKLPKKGASTNNERGKWLVGEKEKRKVKEVDPAWLKDYKDAR
jgi:mono/diheme cytochrome c family protein